MAEAGTVAKAKPPSATAPTNAYLRFFIWRLLSIRVRPNHPFTINENAGRRVPLLEDAAFRRGSNFTKLYIEAPCINTRKNIACGAGPDT